MSILSLKNIQYTYPLETEPVIKNVSLDLEAGKVYGVIGGNESGKTTLCNIMRGFIPELYKGTLSGDVLFNGKSISEYNIGELAAHIGYSFQNPFTQISGVKETVSEEIAYGMENLGVPREKMIQRVDELIQLFQLDDLKDKNPFELSGGQKQRVALASIVALDPEIIILDEPTSQLDPKSTEDIFKIVKHLKKAGKTIFLVEHKVDLLAEYCDEILVMSAGELVMKGKTTEILTDEKVVQYGGQLPQVTLYFLQAFGNQGKVPLTVAEAFSLLKGSE
ncbi:energy-coupling factor ABC transporter ATP-binding protein [Enterococcus sp. AZ109]|uniref:energy-coupling factor ABC transporter ATP-binding protein n=1 Tax=Enterococcus sp. AZ109 TaxID=2774634 RepID=UPI003F20BF61